LVKVKVKNERKIDINFVYFGDTDTQE